MVRSLVVTGVVVVCWLALLSPVQAQGGKKVRHPRLHIALHELREAKADLKKAAHDFGGHRRKAVEAIDAAIGQIELALRATGDNVRGLAPAGTAYKAYKNHPHIRHAVVALEEARTALQESKEKFGGHRNAAIRDIDVAIEQLRVALKFARR